MEIVTTSPIPGQKTGTSGLRKKTSLVESTPNFIENWVQSVVNAIGSLAQKSFAIGGDGRYLNPQAIQSIIGILAANGAEGVVVARDGLMSTPAVSCLIRKRKLSGGFILTASHNPAGKTGDWGIKFNAEAGEPAPESFTDRIFMETMNIHEIKRMQLSADLSNLGITRHGNFSIEVIDPVSDYLDLLKNIFDFEMLRNFCARPEFSLLFDGMNAVTGVYAKKIFCEALGLPEKSIRQCTPLPDFGGGHPDPNLTYAADLLRCMQKNAHVVFGAASDGDGDRNMILGRNGFFVSPSDSVAIIANYAEQAIPYFARHKILGVARSMPTSRALDIVAAAKKFPCFQTPTGWKYFGNLMDAGLANLCGEESFGTGGDHIREKDGLWAVMCWLSILAFEATQKGRLVEVEEICKQHWDVYGRHFYRRCDYEECESSAAEKMFEHLREQVKKHVNGSVVSEGWIIQSAEEYTYVDPVDKSVASKQGIIFCFANGGRVIFRLSGTGSSGATIRLYMELYTKEWRSAVEELETTEIMDVALLLSNLQSFTGRSKPTVVT